MHAIHVYTLIHAGLPPIKKNFYFEDPEVASLTETEVEFLWYAIHILHDLDLHFTGR